MKRYFITGTDTDCGKTYVTTQLLQQVPSSQAIKPIASGCTLVNGTLVSSDALQFQEHTGLSLDNINPWRFQLPVSPHIAAQKEDACLSVKEIADYCMYWSYSDTKYLFIEGAGGLAVPLNESETWIDFLLYSKIPVILVVGLKLGCINHALLTVAMLTMHGIKCVGWIANCIDPNMIAHDEVMHTLLNKLTLPLLGFIPFNGQNSVLSIDALL